MAFIEGMIMWKAKVYLITCLETSVDWWVVEMLQQFEQKDKIGLSGKLSYIISG